MLLEVGKIYYVKFLDEFPDENLIFVKSINENEAILNHLACTTDSLVWDRVNCETDSWERKKNVVYEVKPTDLPLYVGWPYLSPEFEKFLQK
jgi:hypothetical protein